MSQQEVLNSLRRAGRYGLTNQQLADVDPWYTKTVTKLRRHGFVIQAEPTIAGKYRYFLHEERPRLSLIERFRKLRNA